MIIVDKKFIIIGIVVVAVIAAGAYLFFSGNNSPIETTIVSEHSTMVLSKSAYMEVPKSNNTSDKVNKKGIHHYNDKNNDINITSCSNLSASSSLKEMKKLKNDVATGAKKSNENGVVIYEKNGTYSVFVRNTQYNDTLLIQSSDKALLLQCWESVKYHDPTQKIKFDDKNDTGSSSSGSSDVIDVSQKTEKAVKSTSTSSSSSSSSKSSSSTGTSSDYYNWGSSSSSGKSSNKAPVSDDRFDVSRL